MQREDPPRLRQLPMQLMEWTPTPTKDDDTTGHNLETTQTAPPLVTEL